MQKTLFSLLLVFSISILHTQNFKFGKVSLDEVRLKTYNKDTTTCAVILHKSRKTYFKEEQPNVWVIVTEFHERIKILKKDGLEYSAIKINLQKSNSDAEIISDLKGFTYLEETGRIKSIKLKKSHIFKKELSKNLNEISFTMPNVKVGSVIEWKYRVKSPFFKIDHLIIQDDIPTMHYIAKIVIPSYFNFNRLINGNFNVASTEYEDSMNLNPRSYSKHYEKLVGGKLIKVTKDSIIQTTTHVSVYELNDIPALIEEPYVDNIDNYRFFVAYELESTQILNQSLKKYSTSWEDVIKTIYESNHFREQLNNTSFLKEDVSRIKSMGVAPTEIIYNAFDFVKNKIRWNGQNTIETKDGIQKAYKENTGNSAQINLMLMALLRDCGIEANPVLISTRDQGIPLVPTLGDFNYVIVCAEINGKDILLDATEKLIIPGMLPERAINWEGILVLDDGQTRIISLYPKKISRRNTIMNVTIHDDGSLEGKQRSSYTNLEALKYRKNYKKYTKEEYKEDIINTYAFDNLIDFKIENLENLNKPIIETFAFQYDEGVDVIGDKMYISPLFFLKMKSNPFKSEERNCPINFVYPRSRKKIVNIKIPEGYRVTSLPHPIKISMPERMGSFLFNISEVAGGLKVISTFYINNAIIPTYRYLDLKELYKQRLLKEALKVVIIRKPKD